MVLGAGKSTSVLIDYLLEQAEALDWTVVVADASVAQAEERIEKHPRGRAVELDARDTRARDALVKRADLVISMLPAQMHPPVAKACIQYKKHFVTASYVSPELRDLAEAAERAGVTLLNEMGVDPGIDHMSAMRGLDELRAAGRRVARFETFTGGLVAPESDNNPWRYKFTWNPRNVVLAGQGGVKFKHNGRYKYVPYHKLFQRYEPLSIPGYGDFEGYPNRDSLRYRGHYDLWDVETIYRGTLRRPGFCRAWDGLVQVGLTDDSYACEDVASMTYRDFLNSYLWYDRDMSVELKLRAYLKLDLNSPVFDKIQWLGLFEEEPIGLSEATPAQILQKRLEEKWALVEDDKDMIAMLHKTEFEKDGRRWQAQSSMVTLGTDQTRTAMAKTVGLPTGIGAKLLLTGVITHRGVVIPTRPEVYRPVLAELERYGILFKETQTELD